MIKAAAYTFDVDRDPYRVFAVRTKFVDSIVEAAAHEHLAPEVTSRFAVAAVGGYGRRELFPFSDIDLLLLFENESDLAPAKEPISEFLQVLWDAGLHVSHSVRTVAECCRLDEQNIELHVSLLDLRQIYTNVSCGDEEIFSKLTAMLPGFYAGRARTITRALAEMARGRHAKFGNTVFHLEPNIKEAPGGIRDIHLLRWLSQIAAHRTAMHELCADLDKARDFVFGLRCFLHLQTNRDNNLLSFELQDEAARRLAAHPIQPEEWMRIYFRHARRVFQSSLRALEYAEREGPSLLDEFRSWRGRLSTPEFTVSRERVFLRNPAVTLSSIESVLRLFVFVAKHGVQLSWDTQRRLGSEIQHLERLLGERPAGWLAWQELLSQPHAAVALREMQETGLLAVVIAEWHSIESLVSRDFYHRYTVDEHTLVAIGNIDSLLTDQVTVPPRFHELLLEEEDHSILRLALLLHDLGKGTAPGDHVRGSVDAAAAAMNRLGVPKPKQSAVTFLIEHHLDLSSIMSGRDLEDPATARFLTSRIGTQEDLRRLTLLTYADIAAVNPTAMTPWRLEQLWRVYSLGIEQLTRELSSDRIHATADCRTQGATHGTMPRELACFLEGLPMRYLKRHTQQEIERHLGITRKISRDGVAVEITNEPGAYLITVLAQDHSGLFASLCGALASFGMNILRAEAASNTAGCVLDFVRFTDPMRTLELNPSEVERLQRTVEGAVKGTLDVKDLLKRRRETPRPSSSARIAPAVRFNNEASDTATLIDLISEDRPRLLYDVASTLSACGCNIETVMIDTQAQRAMDVFYVTRNGGKLDELAQRSLLTELIRVAAPS